MVKGTQKRHFLNLANLNFDSLARLEKQKNCIRWGDQKQIFLTIIWGPQGEDEPEFDQS